MKSNPIFKMHRSFVCCYTFDTVYIIVQQIWIFMIKISRIFTVYIWCKMSFSSLNTVFKLSKRHFCNTDGFNETRCIMKYVISHIAIEIFVLPFYTVSELLWPMSSHLCTPFTNKFNFCAVATFRKGVRAIQLVGRASEWFYYTYLCFK